MFSAANIGNHSFDGLPCIHYNPAIAPLGKSWLYLSSEGENSGQLITEATFNFLGDPLRQIAWKIISSPLAYAYVPRFGFRGLIWVKKQAAI